MNQARVAVLRGGPSEEFDVSLKTGAGVIEVLDKTAFDVTDIIISKTGEWLIDGFERSPADALATTDVVFIALHGAFGEDGTVQRILDRLSIPYTGSTAYASSIAMNKMLAKEHLKGLGIQMAPHMRVTREGADLSRIVYTIESLFGPEYVVKPVDGGSSIDVRLVTGPAELGKALTEMLKEREQVFVEQRIRGKEATCGVIENFRETPLYRLPAVEIVPPKHVDFFEASVKYTGETEEICPGRFTREEKETLEHIAHTVHETLGLSQYSRSDFMINDDGIYFLEVNTLPGLTEESLLPKSLTAIGCTYQDFISHLLTDALQRRR